MERPTTGRQHACKGASRRSTEEWGKKGRPKEWSDYSSRIPRTCHALKRFVRKDHGWAVAAGEVLVLPSRQRNPPRRRQVR